MEPDGDTGILSRVLAKSSPSVFMPRFSAFLLSLLALGSHGAAVAAVEAKTRPNVLLIVSDDQGFSDFGFTGNPLVKTPVLDRLAAESAVFKNFVVAAACSPTRSALYTGREHLGTGVWGVPPRANLRPDEALMPAFSAPAATGLSTPARPTLRGCPNRRRGTVGGTRATS